MHRFNLLHAKMCVVVENVFGHVKRPCHVPRTIYGHAQLAAQVQGIFVALHNTLKERDADTYDRLELG